MLRDGDLASSLKNLSLKVIKKNRKIYVNYVNTSISQHSRFIRKRSNLKQL